MRRRLGRIALLGATLMAVGPLALAADAATVARSWQAPVPMTLTLSFRAQSCGAKLVRGAETIGDLTIDSTTGHFYFSNNAKFTHWSDSSGDMDATVEFGSFTARSSSGGRNLPVGGNPWIFFEVVDGDESLTGVLDGVVRCQDAVDGTATVDVDLEPEIWQRLLVAGSGCNNHKNGAWFEFSLESDADGLGANVYLTNNRPKFLAFASATDGSTPGVHVAAADGTIGVSFAGNPIVQRKGQGGPGGNPHIWAVIPDGAADETTLAIGDDHYLGRCRDFR